MDKLDNTILKRLMEAVDQHIFPGGVVGYIRNGSMSTVAHGQLTYQTEAPAITADTLYDLASVTKSIPTASLILMLAEQGKLTLDDPVIKYVPELVRPGHEEIRIRHLLSFTAVFDLPHPLSSYAYQGGNAVMERVLTTPLRSPAGEGVLYADIPYILLGLIAERISGNSLDKLADTTIFRPLGMVHTTFHPMALKLASIAPSEIVGQHEIVGEAQDEKARVLHNEGQVTGHAGLFSTANDLLIYCRMILNNGNWEGKQYVSPATIHIMQREVAVDGELGFSLGWTTHATYMEPGLTRGGFCKSGYTGTLVAINPETQRAFVMLTNRTYPKRPNTPTAINNVRRDLTRLILS